MSGRVVISVVLAAATVLAIGLPIVFDRRSQEESAVATTADAQEFDQLWRDLGRLQSGSSKSAAEHRREVVRRTARFLGPGSEQETRFARVVDQALRDLNSARIRMADKDREMVSKPDAPDSIIARREVWSRWQRDQRAAADCLLDALQPTPRHRLFAEKRQLWLLRLDYSMRSKMAVR